MKKFDTLEDGSLLFQEDLTETFNRNYQQDPDNPRRLIPIFQKCTARRITLRTMECGLRRADFFCDVFQQDVSFSNCGVCTWPKGK